MRQTQGHRARRETFLSAVVAKLSEVDWASQVMLVHVEGGAPHGGRDTVAILRLRDAGSDVTVNGRTVAGGLRAMWQDRDVHGITTMIEGLSTTTRDRLIRAKAANVADEVSSDDASRIVQVGLWGKVVYR